MTAHVKKRKSSSSDANSDAENTTASNGNKFNKAKKPKTSHIEGEENGKGAKGAWTDELDEALMEIIIKNKANMKMNWATAHKEFNSKFPEDRKTLIALKRRWARIKDGVGVELNDNQKELFKKSVADVKENRVAQIEQIAYRFGALSNIKINKTVAGKLMKAMRIWTLDDSSSKPNEEDDDSNTADGASEDGDKENVKKEDSEDKKNQDFQNGHVK